MADATQAPHTAVKQPEAPVHTEEGTPVNQEVTAYCTKCRDKTVMVKPMAILMKNGKPATKGTCPVCGTGTFRIGKIQ